MNLFENEEAIKKNKNTKKIMIIISVIIVILLVISGILLYMIEDVQKNTMKFTIDNKSKSLDKNLFVFEEDDIYVNIKKFATLMGYETHNSEYKDRYSEDTTKCYISNTYENASYILNSSTIYKKVTNNEDYEYFELEKPVKLIDGELYAIKEGIEIGTNTLINYNKNNNKISVLSLDYLRTHYISQFPNAVVVDENANFNNKKALRYNLIVVLNEEGKYGVYDAEGNEVIGTKYTNIIFKEDSKEFTVTTEEGKMGILSVKGETKIKPSYDEIKKISTQLNYYIVSNNKKYGVINENGNIVIHLEYDKIGVDQNKYSSNRIESPYLLFNKCIPVMQNKKWGIFDVNGKIIIPVEYDEIGCTVGTQSGKSGNNVLIIPKYEAIVLGKEKKYSIVSSSGEQYVPMILDSVYSQTVSGVEEYYMNFTLKVEEDGKIVDKTETYNVEEYFEEKILKKEENLEDSNNILNETNTTVDNNVIDNTESNANIQETQNITNGETTQQYQLESTVIN